MSLSPAERRNLGFDLLLLALLIGGVYLLFLGHRPLAVPSEARYAEIPREMVASGDWLTPRLNGVRYFEKPALFYWLQAAAIGLFGRSEFVARLWTAFFGVAGCLSVYVTAHCLYGRRAGWLAAGTMATALLYFELSRQALLDMPVAFFLTVVFAAFLLGVRAPPDSPARGRAMYVMYAAAALAALTKGLIGIVLPGMTVFVWLLLTGRWKELAHARLATGTLLFLVIAAPWHVAVGMKNPEFFWFYFVHEHFLRFLTPEAGRGEPAWFFLAVVLAGWIPWAVFLPAAIIDACRDWWRDRARHRDELFVLLWFLLPFLFFSASHSKLIPYALPFFPPLALLLGRWLDLRLDAASRALEHGFAALSVMCALLAGLVIVVLERPGLLIPARHVAEVAPVTGELPAFAAAFAIASAVLAIATWCGARRVALVLTVAGAALLGVAGDLVVGQVQPRSVKPLAEILNARLKPDDEVASFAAYYQDLPFYLDRIVTVADWSGELDFGRSVEDDSAWMIDAPEFWRRWGRPDHVMYALMDKAHFAASRADPSHRLFEIAETRTDVLVANRP